MQDYATTSDASTPPFESTHFRPRTIAIPSPSAAGRVRLPVVKIELSTPMAIERLVRNIVTADKNIAAQTHFRLRRRREQDESEDAGEQTLPRHIR